MNNFFSYDIIDKYYSKKNLDSLNNNDNDNNYYY